MFRYSRVETKIIIVYGERYCVFFHFLKRFSRYFYVYDAASALKANSLQASEKCLKPPETDSELEFEFDSN